MSIQTKRNSSRTKDQSQLPPDTRLTREQREAIVVDRFRSKPATKADILEINRRLTMIEEHLRISTLPTGRSEEDDTDEDMILKDRARE